jgi:hypothetical protein
VAGRIRSIEKFHHHIGSRTRVLLTLSLVPQPLLYRVPPPFGYYAVNILLLLLYIQKQTIIIQLHYDRYSEKLFISNSCQNLTSKIITQTAAGLSDSSTRRNTEITKRGNPVVCHMNGILYFMDFQSWFPKFEFRV